MRNCPYKSQSSSLFSSLENSDFLVLAGQQKKTLSVVLLLSAHPTESEYRPPPQVCAANDINGVQYISIIKMPYRVPLESPHSHAEYGTMNGVFCLLTSVCQELFWYRNFYEFFTKYVK
jgi:hypothetical protein